MGSRAAVFVDRDGTLIEDVGYPSRPEQVRLLPGAAGALRAFRERDLALVVISNQSGVGRGYFSRAEVDAVHRRLVADLAAEGAELDGAYYCYHAPADGCSCRKPAPGLIREAARALDLALEASFMIGNAPSDIEAGRRAGCRTIALAPREETEADWTVASWPEAVDRVVGADLAAVS